jgi:hypothetical protein
MSGFIFVVMLDCRSVQAEKISYPQRQSNMHPGSSIFFSASNFFPFGQRILGCPFGKQQQGFDSFNVALFPRNDFGDKLVHVA